MAEEGPNGSPSFTNFDDSVSFLGHQMRSEMLDDSFKNVRFVQDQSEELSKLRIDNFNLRLLCHKYEEVFKRGQIENAGLRIYDLEQEHMKIRGQLGRASRMLSSLRHENEGLKKDNDELNEKLESCDIDWRKKYDSLLFDFQELKSSERRAESRCEVIENESFRLENAKNAEMSTLQQKLTSAESKITLLETELAELRSKENVSVDRLSGFLGEEDKENDDLSGLLDPLLSPLKMSRSNLLRRFSAAQEMLKLLKSNCDSLSVDLSNCRQELSVSKNKFHLILGQYENEKAAHLRDLEQRDELERNLHERISDLLRDCNDKDYLNDELTREIKQMKEFDARIKEEHMRQLNKLHALLEDRERALLELYVPEATHAPAEESEVVTEVTQYPHDPDSSIFNSTVDVVTKEKAQGQQLTDVTSVEMTKLQHEVALLRSKLVAQVKANTRLKAAFNALSESNPPPSKVATTNPPANLSMSINPSILEEAGNTSRGNDSLVSLLDSNKKVSQTLDKTVNELRSALSKVEADLSASLLEVSQIGEEPKHEEDGVGLHDTTSASGLKPDRLRDVYSLIKGLVDQFDNLRTFRNSFHETVNRSILANSLCLETSTKYTIPGTNQQTSFAESARVENGDPSILEASAKTHERDEPAEKSVSEKDDDEVMSLSQLSHNNTTFHLLREHLNDNTMEDLSMTNSLSFATSQRSHALDITGLEMHSRNIFDRVALAVAGIQEALDAWSLDAATELLAAINVNTDTQRPPVSSHNVSIEDPGANIPSLDTLLDLVTRFAELLSKTKYMELLESSAFSDWCDLVHRWFELFIDTLQRHKSAANLTEINNQLNALEQQFNEEFAMTAAVTQHRQNAALQTSDITEPPSISLCENGDLMSSREQLTSTIEKLKSDLSLNIRELTDKKAAVTDLKSKVQDLMAQLCEAVSVSRTKESRVEELEAEISQLRTKLRDLELNAQAMEKKAAELEAELPQSQTKVRSLEAQLDGAFTMVQVRETNVKELEAGVAELKAKLQDMEMQLTEAHLETQIKEVRVQELETEVAESQTKLQNLETQLAESLSNTRAKEIRIQELGTAIKDKELALINLKEQLTETEARLAQKEARVIELKAAANDLRAIYDDLENQFNNTTKDVDEWKAKSERLEDLLAESIERETGTSLKLSSALDEVDSQKEQKLALEARLNEMLEEHKVNIQNAHYKYKSLLEAADSRCAEMAEQCQLLQVERDNLREDLAACKEEKLMLQSDLAMARLISANAQINLGAFLEDGPTGGEKEDLEAIRQKARKYPQLKALAFSLKAKLEKRSNSLHGTNKENARLKMIVGDNEKRVQGFIQELERLRQQILVKNKVIKKLESVVRESNIERPASSVDEISTPENPRTASADFPSPCLFNPEATSYMIDGGIFDNHSLPEHFNGVNSLVGDIDATVREISVCLDAANAEDGGERHHEDTSASLADQMSGFSTDTPTSLTVSFADVPQPPARSVNINTNVPDRLNELVYKLSTFWSAMTHELQALASAVQNNTTNVGGCICEDHMRARKLIRRSIKALGNLSSRHPANMLISHILESLNEALELLHRQNSSSSSPTISRDSLSSNRSESPPFSFHKQQSAEAVAMNNNALPPPQQANHSSSCSCSCRRRCSRMAASVQELTNILNCTASVLAGRTIGREVGGDMGQVQEDVMVVESDATPEDSLDNSLSN